jgi:multiple sugar transport system permease protein
MKSRFYQWKPGVWAESRTSGLLSKSAFAYGRKRRKMQSNNQDNRIKKTETMWGYLFLLPALAFFVAFVLYPMIEAVFISTCNYKGIAKTFTGISNYVMLFRNEVFRRSLLNTVLMVAVNVPLVLVFSLFVALAVYEKSEAVRSFARAAFFLPAVSSIVTIGIVWKWIYNPMFGILNYLTGFFGLPAVNWLGDMRYALWALVLVLFTLSVGQPIILYIAALGNIPATYLEAADIDGASWWIRITRIVWPLIKPTSLYIIIITTINSFQTFAIVQLLTGGGPFYRTSTIVFQLYQTAFWNAEYGLASAMGMILAMIVVIISVIQYKFLSSDVEY